jgi:hypothetical protein
MKIDKNCIEDLTTDELIECFKDAVCDRNYNPSSESYNQSGFSYKQLLTELYRRLDINN